MSEYEYVWCHDCGGEGCGYCDGIGQVKVPVELLFKVSDTPPSGPEKNSGHTATAAPHEHKEIA